MPEIWAAWEQARGIIDAFDPELVVLFGIDHRRAFRSVIPSVAVALEATARGDRDGPVGRYRVPSDIARALAEHLVANDIDIAIAYDVALDHGFGHAARDLLGGIDTRGIIPVFINSASPPAPSLRRAAAIGDVVGSFFDDWTERVLFIGTGGLTHDLPGFYPADDGAELTEDERIILYARLNRELRVPGLAFGPEWDRAFLAGVGTTDREWLDEVGRDVSGRAGNGGNEAVSWVAAWAAGGGPLHVLAHRFDAEFSNGAAVAISSSAVTGP
ncbi:MAG: 3-carboxyethylcatechol 2,3-dioxygenase [Actinobacteria bacterium]|nr:3-carboxyethylcatechol 2,3-dioxygenase [Actinomycetota bacterium]